METPLHYVLTVSELTLEIKELLETKFPEVWVEGEISNFRIPPSGHIYFTLKDDFSQIRAVLFRIQARALRFSPEDGLQVICRGRVGLYEKRNELAATMSIGHRKSLELGKVLATKPEVILLDEVVAGLNSKEANDMIARLKMLRENNITILIIEHVMKAIMSLSDRIVVIHYGEKIGEGKPVEISKDPRVIEAYLGEEYVLAKGL